MKGWNLPILLEYLIFVCAFLELFCLKVNTGRIHPLKIPLVHNIGQVLFGMPKQLQQVSDIRAMAGDPLGSVSCRVGLNALGLFQDIPCMLYWNEIWEARRLGQGSVCYVSPVVPEQFL